MLENLLSIIVDILQSLHGYKFWIAVAVLVMLAIGIFEFIRHCFCWYFRTNKIVSQLEIIIIRMIEIHTSVLEVRKEALEAKLLEKTALPPVETPPPKPGDN
jgi:hypothetical protein